MATTTILDTTSTSYCSILTPRDITKKITWVKKRFESSDYAKPTSYEKQILALQRTFENPDTKSRVKLIFAGLPCHKCRQLIVVGSEFYFRGNGRTSKPYHLSCAREVHLI